MRFLLMFLLLAAACSKPAATPDKKADPTASPPVVVVAESENYVEVPVPSDQIVPPTESIKNLDKKAEQYRTGPNLTPEDLEFNRKLKGEMLHGTFDIAELAKLALDVHWETLSDKDRKYFVNLLTNLLEQKAIFSKEQVKGEGKPYHISYKGEKFLNAAKDRVMVLSRISVPSQKVEVEINYLLKLTPYGWKIYDVVMDQASLLENYKFQFDTIIKKSGYADLVSRMEKKLKEMQ